MSHKTDAFAALAKTMIENLKKEIWRAIILKTALTV